jgi:hypothetical protein
MLRRAAMLSVCYVFLTAGSAVGQDVTVKVVAHHLIPRFPSASSVVYYDEKLYVIGDDSRNIHVLDREYNTSDSIKLFESEDRRIPRDRKADIESAILMKGCRKKLVLFGSGSAPERKRILIITPPKKNHKENIEIRVGRFYELLAPSAGPVNIEAAGRVGPTIVFGNRLTKGHANHFLAGHVRSVLNGKLDALRHTVLTIPDTVKNAPGISDMFYLKSMKTLWLTFSSEETNNPLEDGAIGDSYIGWISNFDDKLKHSHIALDGLMNLRISDARFNGEKIEGICVEEVSGTRITAHLVSDNDDGKSTIFKVEIRIEKL